MTARLIERLVGDGFTAEWLRLKSPCLLILGGLERAERPTWAEEIEAALPDAKALLQPGLGHVGCILSRDRAMEHIQPFLARHAAREVQRLS